ncbi:MAG: Rieske 2Fe-2S domain-containing protein [Myxococcales bacterium]|nr:Rieske 2Fe-2S domain-containing protein [Myxococcales bacterium]
MSAITLQSIEAVLEHRPADGVHRIDRRVFTDPALFELELKYIFESSWVYVAHESQFPEPHDFVTAQLGRQPVIVNRCADGRIGGFVNACAHRGAALVQTARGNQPFFLCPFHGWCYNSAGELVGVNRETGGGYPDQFDHKKLGLTPIAKVESYRGFVFACLRGDVPPLEEHLGEARVLIDLVCDQSPEGLEVLPGVQVYTFDGNWKLQAENGVDGYHVGTIHRNYVETVSHRAAQARAGRVETVDVGGLERLAGGYFDLGHGHTALWNDWSNPEVRPLYEERERLEERFGATRVQWMIDRLRNLLLYPNVFLMDQISTQIRSFRPIAVDRTEVTTVCIAPKGESDKARRTRIRQYEDFFNASGLATPDDLAAFNASQKGFGGEAAPWSDLSRGAKHWAPGGDRYADELGLKPVAHGTKLEDEGIFIAQHTRWVELMSDGHRREASDGNGS